MVNPQDNDDDNHVNVPSKSVNLKNFPNFEMEDDFTIFKERLENIFDVLGTEERQKSGILIAVLGQKIYKILKNLCNPDVPKSKPYIELIKLLGEQFVPRILAYKERKIFYDAKQMQGESITEWHLRVKSLAVDCEFGNNLAGNIKDRFVCGLLKGKIFDRICEEELTVSYEDLLKIALSKELIEKDEISVNKFVAKSINSVHKKTSKFSASTPSKITCFACGKPDHNFSQCKFKKLRCNICNSVGHIAGVCKKKNQLSKVKIVDTKHIEEIVDGNNENLDQTTDSSDDDIVQSDLFHLDIDEDTPVLITVKLFGFSLAMEIDTGSGKSVISYKTYLQHFNQYELIKDNLRMKPYVGSPVEPMGYMDVEVVFGELKFVGRLYVVKGGSRPLIGRAWLSKMNIKLDLPDSNNASLNSIEKVHQLENEVPLDEDVQLLINSHEDLFSEGLGTYRYGTINMKVKPGTTPIFRKPIPVPYAFKEMVDKQLDQWEAEGSIEKVETSDWGTPLTPVLNKKGFRLCANYKVTVNKYLEDFNHPLPRIEDLFAALFGGQEFSKVDLTRAYYQLFR